MPAIAFFCPEPQGFASVEASLSFLSAMCDKENCLRVLYLRNDLTLPLKSSTMLQVTPGNKDHTEDSGDQR